MAVVVVVVVTRLHLTLVAVFIEVLHWGCAGVELNSHAWTDSRRGCGVLDHR